MGVRRMAASQTGAPQRLNRFRATPRSIGPQSGVSDPFSARFRCASRGCRGDQRRRRSADHLRLDPSASNTVRRYPEPASRSKRPPSNWRCVDWPVDDPKIATQRSALDRLWPQRPIAPRLGGRKGSFGGPFDFAPLENVRDRRRAASPICVIATGQSGLPPWRRGTS